MRALANGSAVVAARGSLAEIPALALIAADGELERSTEDYEQNYRAAADALGRDKRVEEVLSGELERSNFVLKGVAVNVEAVIDPRGDRQALAMVHPAASPEPAADAKPNPLLSARFDDSPALIWLKDLEGRYLQANARYAELLNTSEDRLVGKTDEELPAGEVVDGPRILESGSRASEPLQFEYTVGSFEGRPPLAALRFAIRDRAGEPVAVCGLASPLDDAATARTECARLMKVERWSRIDPVLIRAEVLDEWGLVPVAERQLVQADPADPQAIAESEALMAEREKLSAERDAALLERDAALEAVRQTEEADVALQDAREELERMQTALQEQNQRAEGADATAEQEREKLRIELERAETAERELRDCDGGARALRRRARAGQSGRGSGEAGDRPPRGAAGADSDQRPGAPAAGRADRSRPGRSSRRAGAGASRAAGADEAGRHSRRPRSSVSARG